MNLFPEKYLGLSQLGGVSMKQRSIAGFVLMCMLFASTAILRAEVKTEEKNQFKMEGAMGWAMGVFGGKAAKEGVISTVAVKGNRKMTKSEYSGEIIDLDEQKIYNVDFKKKSYEVVTFDEMRKRLKEAQEQAAKAAKENAKEPEKPSEIQMEIDFSVKESGAKRLINGYDCREVVMTVTSRQKGKTLEEGGGYVMTSHFWIGPNIPELKEISDFDQRYAKAMEEVFGPGGSAEQMAMAMAMYPGMKDMMGKVQTEKVNMEGAQILTEMIMETVKSPAQMSQQTQAQTQESESSDITSVKGIGGLLGGKFGRKKKSESDEGKPKNRSTIMTINHELLKVSAGISAEDLAVPAGFKEKK
jgi:hypothetical protein